MMAEAWEIPPTSDTRDSFAPIKSIWTMSTYFWFAWWMLLTVLFGVSIVCFAAGNNGAGGGCLLLGLFAGGQTLGWFLLSVYEPRCLASLQKARIGDPKFSADRWSQGARFWLRWHLVTATLALALLVIVAATQGAPPAVVAFFIGIAAQVVMFGAFLAWLAGRRRLAAVAEAARLMDFILWPSPQINDLPPMLATWPSITGKLSLFPYALVGRVADWDVTLCDLFSSHSTGPLRGRYQTLLAVQPTLNLDFLLSPRDMRDKINWVGMVFHLMHPIGWAMIALELGTKLFKRKDPTPGHFEVRHEDPAFRRRYELTGTHQELLLLLFQPHVRGELMPKQWNHPSWYVAQANGMSLLGRPGMRVEPTNLPEFVAECLRLIRYLQEAEEEALTILATNANAEPINKGARV